ncbi:MULTISPECIES: hypothetical protein [Gordonibacter]|uniref:Trigger factor C-terminal domain-containing protein n=1 Tax=Gordonibacter faecis TaxID=3047475 RepID=A0ABT7DLP3_9ACTN|nr:MULTISPECIES: hypothetical protein [unclassified Gordonibacter]MDJ1650449.1 hypothetical protein [Gordonibacter sp. KGMB12511]HIW76920.1 hypothetical protein [Candidatus Gordonibacter avicola]
MQQSATAPELDLDSVTLSSYERVRLTMPSLPHAKDDDVDAQLFEYVASADKDSHITCIADLDDEWVRSMFDGMNTMAELRDAIKRDLDKHYLRDWNALKFQRCTDALVARVEADISDEVLDKNVEASRAQYDQRLASFGMTKAQYLREERMTEEEYEQKLRDDVAFQLKLNAGLDKLIEATNIDVPKSELHEYLACDDPAEFAAELEKNGKVEEARHAAARVKAMRRLVEAAEVEIEPAS